MSITSILTDEETSDANKLVLVAEIVDIARKSYDNEDAVIAPPSVSTLSGELNFVHLKDESKVQLLYNEIDKIKVQAIESAACNKGININKKIEELISCNPMFVNILSGTKFDYI